jgi:hypothetical protein
VRESNHKTEATNSSPDYPGWHPPTRGCYKARWIEEIVGTFK